MKKTGNWRLNLAGRGFLILALPLALQLGLVATLCYIHDKAEQYSVRAGHARNFNSAYARYLGRVYAAINRVDQAVAAHQPLNDLGRKDEAILISDSEDLERNIRLHQTAGFQGAIQLAPSAVDELRGLTERVEQLAPLADKLAQIDPDKPEYKQLRDKLQQTRGEAIGKLNAFGENPLNKIVRTPEFWAEDRTFWASVVVGGIITNIAAAILLLLFFNRSIVNRLLVILDNSIRLAREDDLHPQLPGTDEIAELDGAFHNMADALSEAMRKQRLLIENARDVICSIDDEGVFLAVSSASSAVFGYSPSELTGSNVLNVLLDEDGAALLKHFADLRGGKDEPEIETRFIRKDKKQVDILWSAYWSEPAGAAICVAHDITERKGAERLRQEVMQMVSHDLRSPLSTIQAFHTMLGEGMFGPIDGKGQQFLASADFSSRRMLTLINDLLEIEKMDAGGLELQKQVLDVSEIFEEALRSVTATAATKGVRLRMEETEAVVYGDPDRLLQILINLLSNAIKFTPPEALVTLSAVEMENVTEMRVTDQGRGIPENQLKSIFDRFKQARASDARNKSGFGLGLAICKALVELHGGEISVESNVGVGSVFTIRIASRPPVAIDAATGEAVDIRQSIV